MAALRSLGLHKPSGLAYLIAESILPEDPPESSYTWETYNEANGQEEVLVTDSCVVWSRGGIVRKVFSFEYEKQKVQQAVLTWFPSDEDSTTPHVETRGPHENDTSQAASRKRQRTASNFGGRNISSARPSLARALVVFLQHQAHVYFLSGASHVLDLHFEVERAFPAPNGLILQRKLAKDHPIAAPTPLIPPAPPNSFFSQLSIPLSQPQSSVRGSLKGPAPGELNFDLLKRSTTPATDTLPRHFSLTNPLSEMGLVVYSPPEPRMIVRSSYSTTVRELESLEKDEDILYVSAMDEIPHDSTLPDTPLTLVVTANKEKRMYTIWQAMYTESRPASSLFTGRTTPASGTKTRRRSSFVTTGATTPTVRGRESLGGPARAKTVPTLNASQTSKASAEDVMVSQLDPDFDARQPAKESRRVSSLLSRADLSTNFDRSAFEDLATHRTSTRNSFGPSGRRGQSLGGAVADRTSFGIGTSTQRKLRASTPGAFSRLSIDEESDIGTVINHGGNESATFDDLDDFDDILPSHMAFDAIDFQQPFTGLKTEVLVTKLNEISMNTASANGRYSFGPESSHANTKVFTISSPKTASEAASSYYGRRFFLHIMNRDLQDHVQIEFSVQRHRETISIPHPDENVKTSQMIERFVPVAACKKVTRLRGDFDATKIFDGDVARVICLQDSARQRSLRLHAPWSPESPLSLSLEPLKVFNPYDLAGSPTLSPRAVGKKRTVLDPKPMVELLYPGPEGIVTLRDVDHQLHRVQIQLGPRNELVARIIELCLFALPGWIGDWMLTAWWSRYKAGEGSELREWDALVESIFAMAIALDEPGMKRRKSQALNATGSSTGSRARAPEPDAYARMMEFERSWPGSSWTDSPAWSWAVTLAESSPTASELRPQLNRHILAARDFVKSKENHECITCLRSNQDLTRMGLTRLLITLHLLREERKLDCVSLDVAQSVSGQLSPVLAQLGRWMGWDRWDWQEGTYFGAELIGLADYGFEDVTIRACSTINHPFASQDPPSIYAWLEQALTPAFSITFPSLEVLVSSSSAKDLQQASSHFFPRSTALSKYLVTLRAVDLSPEKQVEALVEASITTRMLDTFPEAIVAILKDGIVKCQANPPTTWTSELLELVGREDLVLLSKPQCLGPQRVSSNLVGDLETICYPINEKLTKIMTSVNSQIRDVHSICHTAELPTPVKEIPESDRFTITRLIFSEDRRYAEALKIIEPLRVAHAECIPDPSWSEAQVLDAQKEIVQWVMVRTFALSPGQAMAHFDSRRPLLTEKYLIHGYSTLCIMKPMNITVSADRTSFTEERYGWAWYHAGVAAGLSISRHAEGIDTSWIVFNKPAELNNRHAGLLLALGLNGHLKNIAKWLAFKYLTPKHTMTSIGLLLGLSASQLGTMDTLVTRLLSVHVTRMLPPGAAELNLSPLTQTAGLMGIGLLYYATQHRRMSEIMLSEIENVEIDDPAGAPDSLRDESYRLAAGFALGYINLGEGNDLKGLHDMRIIERLLAVAVGPRPVDLVHILDQATAGATIAIALIFMKTGNKAVARKVDVPDTLPQFEYVRPDILLLRTLAKHIILWSDIQPTFQWIIASLPKEYAKQYHLRDIKALRSEHMSFFNILSGLLWSISLKHAGSGDLKIRDFLLKYLDSFIRICKLPALRYDAKLTRNTVRNCQDLLALSCATVMAGTGDIDVMRRLRLLHGRVNADTPYGSHLAAHMALGTLFLGGGSFTFGTSNLAIASLICAFYPLFPRDVTDNKAHLQAFRHLWVLASEARCIVTRDVDTNRAIRVPLTLNMRDGTIKPLTAPCLLPALHTVARIETSGSEYWPIVLDFSHNPLHLSRFKRDQTLHVRRRAIGEAQMAPFAGTLIALNDAQTTAVNTSRKFWEGIFKLKAFRDAGLTPADLAGVLPMDERSSMWFDSKSGVVDGRLILSQNARGGMSRDGLWNLRLLFRWAEWVAGRADGGKSDGGGWISREVIEGFRGAIEDRGRRGSEAVVEES